MEDQPTIVTIGESHGRGIGNVTIQNVKFFGRPNFSGNPDRHNKQGGKRYFNILVPEEVADEMKRLGWMVNTLEPRPEFPEDERKRIMKINIDVRQDPKNPADTTRERIPDIWVVQGDLPPTKMTSNTMSAIDSYRFETMDIEFRGWEYDPEELPGTYSARLLTFVGVMRPSLLGEKYGLRG